MSPRPQSTARGYRAANKLSGKVALITGGDSGIGRAVAIVFAKEGADVAIVYLFCMTKAALPYLHAGDTIINTTSPASVFLASDGSSYMTGQVLHPNGGEIING